MRNLELANNGVDIRHDIPVRTENGIRAGRNDDLVVAVGRNRNQCNTRRRRIVHNQVRQLDLTLPQQRQSFLRNRIVADTCKKPDVRAKTPRGERLVRTLAACKSPERRFGHGFAGCR